MNAGRWIVIGALGVAAMAGPVRLAADTAPNYWKWAPTPPMGWKRAELGDFADRISVAVPPHGAVLLRLRSEPKF